MAADLTTHNENKREMFDGMRAYHDSELAHKNDAIGVLKSIFAGTITIFAAIIGARYSGKLGFIGTPVIAISWIAFTFSSLPTFMICLLTHLKISGDHIRYDEFLKEYARECVYLGLTGDFVEVNGERIRVKRIDANPKAGRGFRKTQYILWTAGVSQILLALSLAIVGTLIAD